MTAQSPQSDFCVNQSSCREFETHRSQWLDAFAQFETAVCRCLMRVCGEQDLRKVPLASRLQKLDGAKPSPNLSKSNASNLQKISGSSAELLTMRAWIVHSTMSVGQRDGHSAALFRNADDAARGLPIYLVMTRADFETSLKDLRSRTSQLNNFLSPCAPPRPKPGEAGGP
jgi:hypothetical protein